MLVCFKGWYLSLHSKLESLFKFVEAEVQLVVAILAVAALAAHVVLRKEGLQLQLPAVASSDLRYSEADIQIVSMPTEHQAQTQRRVN